MHLKLFWFFWEIAFKTSVETETVADGIRGYKSLTNSLGQNIFILYESHYIGCMLHMFVVESLSVSNVFVF